MHSSESLRCKPASQVAAGEQGAGLCFVFVLIEMTRQPRPQRHEQLAQQFGKSTNTAKDNYSLTFLKNIFKCNQTLLLPPGVVENKVPPGVVQ